MAGPCASLSQIGRVLPSIWEIRDVASLLEVHLMLIAEHLANVALVFFIAV